MESDRQNFLLFWTIFLHFYSPKNPKKQNFKKMKKKPGEIILYICTKNQGLTYLFEVLPLKVILSQPYFG